MRTLLRPALVVALLLAAAGCATLSDSGTVIGTVDKIDPETRTISIGGKILHVPEDQNFVEIEQGSKYKISYERDGDHYVLTEIEMKR